MRHFQGEPYYPIILDLLLIDEALLGEALLSHNIGSETMSVLSPIDFWKFILRGCDSKKLITA